MLPVTVGVNEKGGIDSKEFEKYIKNSIVPLFPHARDEPGKRVILKVDSGPGRCNINLIMFLQNLGFILYPGVPNTTAVTQETDRNYGSFKTQFQTNLHKLSDYRLDFKDKVLLQPMILGLLVFGGTDPVTKEEIPLSAFERGFNNEICLHAWTEVGAAPLMRKCLVHKKVLRSIGDGDAKVDELHLMIQDGNDLATHALI